MRRRRRSKTVKIESFVPYNIEEEVGTASSCLEAREKHESVQSRSNRGRTQHRVAEVKMGAMSEQLRHGEESYGDRVKEEREENK